MELTIEEEQKRLYASKKEEPTRVQYSGISGFVNFSGWKVCRDVGSSRRQSGHNEGVVHYHTPNRQENSDIGRQHGFEIVNRKGRSAI